MDLQALKPVRVVLATLFFAACAIMFLDLRGPVAAWVSSIILPLQLVPSLAKTLVGFGAWTVGLLGIVLLTVLAGRVYCSTICPLGTLQDIVIHQAERRRRRQYRYDRPRYGLHYAVGGVTTAAWFALTQLGK